ncbi:hypothetical protein KL86DYS1_30074 [uncultured Dysgonomonas sp.]|uniref:Uncharacterized protein n=1 Tax=uncultured Dysgonomonas sp. TaxID=206096 RepID=A0A212JQP5_9BACT|nr:hypothetical protein KL86DYS1_30074 [uncultured Dysgonomonas sp.]
MSSLSTFNKLEESKKDRKNGKAIPTNYKIFPYPPMGTIQESKEEIPNRYSSVPCLTCMVYILSAIATVPCTIQHGGFGQARRVIGRTYRQRPAMAIPHVRFHT